MRNRLGEREEYFKEKKKDKQIQKTNQLKMIDEQLKPGNRIIYKKREDFLAWCNDMNLFLKSIPDDVDDSMKMGYIKRTIENEDMKSELELCESSKDLMNIMASRHVDEKI